MIFYFIILNADEGINISEQYFKRSQQYPTNGYKKIIVLSPYRTGSTFVFNVLRFLFEDLDNLSHHSFHNSNELIVKKTHNNIHSDADTIFFCPIRNPIDTCFSRYRVWATCESETRFNTKRLNTIVEDYLFQMQQIKSLKARHKHTILLKYEDFVENFEFLFNQIENVFDIKICKKDKDLMAKALSKDNVSIVSKKYHNFSTYDTSTLFHGNHVEGDKFPPDEKDRIKDTIRKKLLEKCDSLDEYTCFIN